MAHEILDYYKIIAEMVEEKQPYDSMKEYAKQYWEWVEDELDDWFDPIPEM